MMRNTYPLDFLDAENEDIFLKNLNPDKPFPKRKPIRNDIINGEYPKWIFRGQGLHEWKLMPYALREKGFAYLASLICGNSPVEKNTTNQRYLEMKAVAKFIELSHKEGISMPELTYEMRSELLQILYEWPLHEPYPLKSNLPKFWTETDYPHPSIRSVVALAQHSLIPTRMLDWTFDPYIAAFFACFQAINEISSATKPSIEEYSDKNISVYGLALQEFKNISGNNGMVEIVDAPYTLNPNMKLQKGVFTLNSSKFLETPIENISHLRFDMTEVLYKINLPYYKILLLLKKLDAIGVNSASLFEGYNGVLSKLNLSSLYNYKFEEWIEHIAKNTSYS